MPASASSLPPSPARDRTNGRRRATVVFCLVSAVALTVTVTLLRSGTMPREAAFMTGIFLLAGGLWVTEALPLFATSLLVIALQILLLANPGGWPGLGFSSGESPRFREVLNAAVDPVLLLFFGGFVLAQAALKEGVDRAVSSWLLRPFGSRPRTVLLGLMLITLLFSMWMSNTATTAMMLTLVTPMLAAMPPGEPFRKALILGIPFAANIGGMGTPVASPPNAIALSFLRTNGHQVAFLDWMLVAIPLMAVLALLTWWRLLRCFPPTTTHLKLDPSPPTLTARGRTVVGVFALTVAGWMTEPWHGLPPSVVALFPAVALSVTGIFRREDLGRLDWSILILIAGGISLGSGLQLSGLDRIALQWLPVAGIHPAVLLTLLVLATLAFSSLISNTATVNLILPLGLAATAVAGAGLSPVQAALSVALAASMSMVLPISTPPNAMAYARGEFTTRDMARVALPVAALAAVLIVAGGGTVMRVWGVIP